MKNTASRRASIARSLIILLASLSMVACDGGAAAPATLHGSWIGEGQFQTRYGAADVKAQLEILTDGSYRFLILEPSLLALAGMERGNWTRTGDVLALTPATDDAEPAAAQGAAAGPSGMAALRSKGSQSFRPKSLTVAEGLTSLNLSDGPMNIRFTPNHEATQKLQDAGEL